MALPTMRKGNTMTKTFDDAVKPGRVAFKQPFNEAYGIIGRGRRVKIVPDDNCVHYCRFKATDRGAWKPICRKEFENANRRLCIENAPKWANAQ